MNTHNNACFTHLCGNCPCTDKNSKKINIGTRLRTPKKEDKRRWKHFVTFLYGYNPWFKSQVEEFNLLKDFKIDLKTLDNRRNTYTEYRGHRLSLSIKEHDKWKAVYIAKILRKIKL